MKTNVESYSGRKIRKTPCGILSNPHEFFLFQKYSNNFHFKFNFIFELITCSEIRTCIFA